MPASLKSITGKKATIHVPLDSDDPESAKVRIVYRSRAITERKIEQINETGRERYKGELTDARQVRAFIQSIVTEWDLLADPDDSDPVPLTSEGLADVPTAFLIEILEATVADQKPDPTTRNA